MNNKEKEKYFKLKTNLDLYLFNQLSKNDFVLKNSPTTLYKFRKFDKYTIDMIKNNYVYLARADTLDDPFDCLIDPDSYINFDYIKLKFIPKMAKYINKIISEPNPSNVVEPQKDLNKLINNTIVYKTPIDVFLKKFLLESDGVDDNVKWQIINIYNNIIRVPSIYESPEMFDIVVNLFLNAKQKMGICSLTTKRDNKVMWSIYGDIYKGYCVEYNIPIKVSLYRLLPVIYKNKYNNNVHKAVSKYLIRSLKRVLSIDNGQRNLAPLIELLCTKDADWSHQDEWRMFGLGGDKCYKLTIKAIYLGFDVSKKNQNVIIELSKIYNFSVFKMNKPSGSNKISYILL